MGYRLIIAEKPSVAASIAKIVGANTPHREKANGYLEGNGYRVSWAFGHLVGLDRPEDLGFTGEMLPILPKEWKTHIIHTGKGDYDAMVSKQMKTLDSLMRGADEIIEATDAGREGELIFRYIYEYTGCTKHFSRLWISSLTDDAIREGMNNLIDGSQMASLSEAAHARSEADWLVGFNASRALRLSSGYKGNLSLGRVQTPVLVMVCDRYEANKNFVPTPYWQIAATLTKDGVSFVVETKRKYDKQEEAKADEKLVREAGQMRVISVEKKQVTTKPPLLFDLTSLQRAANSKWGMTADETLKVAQSLYEKKYLSYPRTGSRFIPEDVFRTIPSLIGKIAGYGPFAEAAANLQGKKLCRKSVNDSKVTDHHALLPTNNIPSGLSGREKDIWELVAGRMLEAFGEDSLSDRTSVELDANGIRFTATGSVITKLGWKAVFGADAAEKLEAKKEKDEESDDETPKGKLPEMRENEHLPAKDIKTVGKTDKPLPLYTDASLLGDMETCGKKIEDEELRDAMKDVGLGTPATRAAIIETLLNRGYVLRSGKKLIPTELGTKIANTVRGRKIANVTTTGEWERDLSLIEQGKARKKDFDRRIKDYVLDIIDDISKNCGSFDGVSATNEPTRTCPCCGQPMKNMKFSVVCDTENGGCGFKINRQIAGKKLTAAAIDVICNKGQTPVIKGFKSKSGSSFDARLKVKKDTRELAFDFDTPPAFGDAVCPCCSQKMTDDKWKLSCRCGLLIYKTQGGVNIGEKGIKTLLEGKNLPVKGMTSKEGKKYDTILVVDKEQRKIVKYFPPKAFK